MRTDEAANPYASPVAEEQPAPKNSPPQPGEGGSWRLVAFWIFAYTINLPVAVIFGFMGTDAWGKVGMFLAIFAVFAAGVFYVRLSAIRGKILSRGLAIFALSQLYPLLQIFTGLVVGALIESLGLGDNLPSEDGVGLLGAMLATVLVSAAFLAFGLMIGGFLYLITPPPWWGKKPHDPVVGF